MAGAANHEAVEKCGTKRYPFPEADKWEEMSEMLERTPAQRGDRRVRKTRNALQSAFNELLLAKGYEDIGAGDIAGRANVGRSTFYEHFRSKDDLLAQSLNVVVEPLAEACVQPDFQAHLILVVAHFWQQRRMARALLSGQTRIIMSRQLTRSIEQRLSARACRTSVDNEPLPHALIAAQLAHGQLALIDAWLSGRHACPAETVARALHRGSYAVADALGFAARPK